MRYTNKIFIVCFLLSSVLISGCATQFRVTPPPGKNQTSYYADKVECQQIASYRSSSAVVNSYGGSASSGQSINEGMFFDCLRGKGYKIDFQ